MRFINKIFVLNLISIFLFVSNVCANRCISIIQNFGASQLIDNKAFDIFRYPTFDSEKKKISFAEGVNIFKTAKVFTEEELDHILEVIPYQTKGSQIRSLDYTHFKSLFYWKVRKKLGKIIADKIIVFAESFQSEVRKRTDIPFFLRVYLRAGPNMTHADGHVHFANSLVLNKTERGAGAWIILGERSKNEEKIHLTNDESVIFTNQYHGSPENKENRVCILVEAIFENPIMQRIGEYL